MSYDIEQFSHFIVAMAAETIALYFLVGGFAKLISYASFKNTLYSLPYLPHKFIGPIATLIISAEIALALLSLLSRNPGYYLMGLAVMLMGFTMVIAMAIHRRQFIKCNCFGPLSEQRIGFSVIYRNAALILVIALAFYLKVPTSNALSIVNACSLLAMIFLFGQIRNITFQI